MNYKSVHSAAKYLSARRTLSRKLLTEMFSIYDICSTSGIERNCKIFGLGAFRRRLEISVFEKAIYQPKVHSYVSYSTLHCVVNSYVK